MEKPAPGGGRTTIAYIIDAGGRRIGRKVDGELLQRWIYNDTLRPIAQLAPDGALQSVFVYSTRPHVPDLIVRPGEGPGGADEVYRVIADHLGSVRLVVRLRDGAIVHRLNYDAWGNVTSEHLDPALNNGTPIHPFGFVGGLYDRETRLVRFGARDYDPEIGRWTTKDPAGLEAGYNLYIYCGANPVGYIDPTGLVVSAPGFWGSLVPVYGPGRQAIHDFQTGHYVWGTINTALAISDLFLAKSLVMGLFKGSRRLGLFKGAWKTGSHSWKNTRSWYERTGRAVPYQEVHHWLVPRRMFEGTWWEAIFNQPWNLMPMESQMWHNLIEGKMGGYGLLGRLWHGSPAWFKQFIASFLGRDMNLFRDHTYDGSK